MNVLNAILELQCYKWITEEKRANISLMASGASSLLLDAGFENICNAYDVFCSMYLDGHIDKKRFLSDYSQEIIDWVEAFPDDYGEDSAYQNTLEVYKQVTNAN